MSPSPRIRIIGLSPEQPPRFSPILYVDPESGLPVEGVSVHIRLRASARTILGFELQDPQHLPVNRVAESTEAATMTK